MNESAPYLLAIGEVLPETEFLKDQHDQGGIRVRTPYDRFKTITSIPFAYPLLPKTIQTPPKEGEAVLVVFMQLGNSDADRFYIGPIISQKQYFYNEQHMGGIGSPTNFLSGEVHTQVSIKFMKIATKKWYDAFTFDIGYTAKL